MTNIISFSELVDSYEGQRNRMVILLGLLKLLEPYVDIEGGEPEKRFWIGPESGTIPHKDVLALREELAKEADYLKNELESYSTLQLTIQTPTGGEDE